MYRLLSIAIGLFELLIPALCIFLAFLRELGLNDVMIEPFPFLITIVVVAGCIYRLSETGDKNE